MRCISRQSNSSVSVDPSLWHEILPSVDGNDRVIGYTQSRGPPWLSVLCATLFKMLDSC